MSEIVEALGFDKVLFIVQIINFTLLVLFLKKVAYAPLHKALESREQKEAETKKKLEVLARKESVLDSLKAEKLAEARKEGDAMISQAKKKAEVEAKAVLEKAEKDAQDLVKRAKESAEREQKSALDGLEKKANALVKQTLLSSLGEMITEDQQSKLVKSSIEQISKVN